MLQPLRANERRLLLRWSVTTCTAAALLLPLAARPDSALPSGRSLLSSFSERDVPARLEFPTLIIRHDPFARPPVLGTDGGDGIDPDLALPPNAGIASAPVVRAVVLSGEPKALVDIDGRTAIVGIGSELGGSPVTGITTRGVRLQDGEFLTLDGARP